MRRVGHEWYAICYDIAHQGCRARVARILLGYGRRLQRSVYEVWLDPEDLPELRRRVGPLLARTDLFDILPIDTRRPESRLSWQRPPRPDAVVLAGPFPHFDETAGDFDESCTLSSEETQGYDSDTRGDA
ncbi:MAG TPA: CRISPR-associated endonuclease Cas2 [Isosphaeraceae bacterium]|nr:CRISPR-associated endonuclease Cas2 [Isosphaeraceae bacterium]